MKSTLRAILRHPLILPFYLPAILFALCNGMLIPVLPLYAKALDVSYGLIGLVAIIVVFRLAGRMTVSTFFNVYSDSVLELPTATIGALSAVGQLLSVPAALVAPLLVARWGIRSTIVWGSLGIALCMLPLALISHWSAAGFGFMGVTALFSLTTAPLRVYT